MVDVTDATFEQEVIERSKTVPVVVDLWAPWCGPCRTLGPILEEVVDATEGGTILAKVNVDENPQISSAFQVQGIPAVYGLRNGAVVDGFVGAQGKDAVKAFVEGLLPTAEEGEVERLLALGDIPSLRLALELDPGNETVTLALARAYVDGRGDRRRRPAPRRPPRPRPGRRRGPAGAARPAGGARVRRPPHRRVPQEAHRPDVLRSVGARSEPWGCSGTVTTGCGSAARCRRAQPPSPSDVSCRSGAERPTTPTCWPTRPSTSASTASGAWSASW